MTQTRTRKFLLVLAIGTLAAAPVFAQKQTPPAGGPPKPFAVPAHETYALPNGLQVTLIPYGNLPKVFAVVAVRVGSLNEPKETLGVADLTGRLLKEGTTALDAKALAEATARMGSSLDTGVTPDETTLSLDVLTEYGPDAVKLLADVAQHPLLPESELPRLKTDLLRQVAIAKTRSGQIALARFRKILYGDHPYGDVLPTEDTIQKTAIADVKKFYESNYGAARAHIYVAGKFDVPAVKKAIAESLSRWAKGPAPLVNVPKMKPQHVLDVTDRPGAPQSTLYIGLTVPDANSPDSIPFTVMNSLLGGSFGSRITSNIREQKGYTYSPSSQISRRYRDAYWAEVADVTTSATGPSLKEIFGEIERLQKEPPPAAELQGIQSFLSGLFVIQNSSRQALIGQLRFLDLQGLNDDYLKTYVQKVNAVTPADVQRMTAQYIKPELMTIVVVGDKAKITEQLAPFVPAAESKQ